jgi:hypothetical protein
MSIGHDPESDRMWANFNAIEQADGLIKDIEALVNSEAEQAQLECRYQEIERCNAYLIHRVLGLPTESCPYAPPPGSKLDENIRILPTYSEATLFLQPDRVQEFMNEGFNESEAMLKGSPFIMLGDEFPERTDTLIDGLMSRVGAVHDIRKDMPGTEIWTGTIQGQVIDFVSQSHTIMTPTLEDEFATTNMHTLYARKEHGIPGAGRTMPDLSAYGHLPPRYRRARDSW